ncbi:AraC family transcriptional regulator [Nocardia sp. NEAU-G5]|uniref:AraC family transcriptional regulator n=1 Tax=Nocardia albiluteola TaxID=2842303 RepID=A0ABS6B576_9NOCA|nr:AraC family transcriptional regulator ligand-binding domain-containing protein [Nocardia albiluteola]MBU3062709.1 AraC family transcriptional regulator [Nocardia albiluteola]MBU3065457.1 AraC family transcriptional regulator [Nocardia albiluteola]
MQRRRFTIERDAAGIQTLHRDLLAEPNALARVIAFPAPPAERLPLHDEIFGMWPEFDADENVLAFDSENADAHCRRRMSRPPPLRCNTVATCSTTAAPGPASPGRCATS